MVVTDIQACFAIGALYADLAAPVLTSTTDVRSFARSDIYARFRQRALIYPALFLGPSATLFMLAWPGWESQYLSLAFADTDGAPLHAALFAAFLFLLAAAAWFGNWLGFRWVLAGARRRLRLLTLGILAATVALVAVRWQAFLHLGSVQAFGENPAHLPFIWSDSVFFVSFLALTAYCAAPLLVWWVRLRQQTAARPDESPWPHRASNRTS
jgi:hypothetical protein